MGHADPQLERGTQSLYDRVSGPYAGNAVTRAVTQNSLQAQFNNGGPPSPHRVRLYVLRER
jgi:hypothetical protein